MHIPIRLANAARSSVEPGLIMSAAVATAVFTTTPIALPYLIVRFDIDTGAAGLISGAQLLGFVLTSFLAGRFVAPSRRLFVIAVALLTCANLASAIIESFSIFLALRGAAGLALGILTWLAWVGTFGDPEKMGDIAVIGPIAGVVAAPVIGVILQYFSVSWVYAGLAMISISPLLRVPQFPPIVIAASSPRKRGGAPAAYLLVLALGLLTLGGSAVFIYSGVIARDEHGLSPQTFSWIMALNALAGVPSARWKGARPGAGVWFMLTGVMAVLVTLAPQSPVFTIALVVWGFAFWFGVPAAYQLLSENSLYPAQRAGDAQAVMAIGRIIGPVIGGAAVAGGSFGALGGVGGGSMMLAGILVLAIEFRPRPRARTRTEPRHAL